MSTIETKDYGQINVTTCSILNESKLAINAEDEDDQCSICLLQWSKFVEPSIAVILPCNHACCAKCLSGFKNICFKPAESDQENPEFMCILCRKELSISIIHDTANFIIEHNLLESLNEFSKDLPLSQENKNKLIVQLLKDFEFDISRVENTLFNMLGMLVGNHVTRVLNSEEKQKFFEAAREPVKKLQIEYNDTCLKQYCVVDTDSDEWHAINTRRLEIKDQLRLARANAASDIFERINSGGNMGALIDGDEESLVFVDLHGLFVNEAKEKAIEFIQPFLPVLKKMVVITGHGSHNQSGESVLKNAMREHFVSLGFKCRDVEKNKGALFIYFD